MPNTRVNRLIDKIKLKEFKLNSLLEVTKAVNNNLSTDKLLNIYEYILREQLGITKLLLFDFGNDWRCLLGYGVSKDLREIDVERTLGGINEITVIESTSDSSIHMFDIVIPVYHKEVPLAYLLIGDLDENEVRISPTIRHMPFIQTLTNIIVVAIENKRLAKESIAQERVKRELEVAAEIQSLLFPTNLPSNEKMDVAAEHVSKQLVGGDYYDFIRLNEDEYVICIADVSGKGISAALVMSNFQANLKAIVRYNYTRFTMVELVKELNSRVMEVTKGEKFITFFVAYYNCSTRVLKYINAGHNYPILTDGKMVKHLDKGTTGLGMFDELPFLDVEELRVDENSTLICFTDGLVELENETKDPFETERLVNLLRENYDLKMVDFNRLVFSNLDEFKGGKDYLDDTALLSCRIF